LGIIYKAYGQKDKAKKYLNSAESSAFELGPLAAAEVTKALRSL
jgi:hypothetical protein